MNDDQGNLNSIPLHFFLHDADEVTGGPLNIDYIDIKIKDTSTNNFGSILTYNTMSSSSFNNLFTSKSNTDASFGIQEFTPSSITPTTSHTFDFQIQSDWTGDFISIDQKYWYFTFNIPTIDLQGFGNIIDIEVSIGYSNLTIIGDDVIRMRIFRSDSDIPSLPNFYRGDTHLHSMFTQSDAEVGLPLTATKEAAKLIGLDWITTTDHTSDFDNYGTQNIITNWSILQTQANQLNNQDSSLIFIAGQEVAVNNSAGKLVHMLAYPNQNSPYALPFLGDGGGDLSATSVTIDNVITQLNYADGFAYAAHPFATKDELPSFPVNGGIWNLGDAGFPSNSNNFPLTSGNIICNDVNTASDVLDENDTTKFIKDNLVGAQIWNMRANLHVAGTSGDELDPWDVKNNGTPISQVDTNDVSFHYKRFSQGQEIVNYVNQLGLLLKNTDSTLNNWKMYYSAGADAHGSFNSSNTENVGGIGNIDNNAVGKVNTLVFCSNGMSANGEHILEGLRNGNSTISDGPVLSVGISKNGNDNVNEILMGQDAILDDVFAPDTYINFNYSTTNEFGYVTSLKFYVGTETGEQSIILPLTDTLGNHQISYILSDLLDQVFGVGNTPFGQYFYIRAELQTFKNYTGYEQVFRTNYDIFHSNTNPIWIKFISTVGINETTASNLFTIYPNPVINQLTIKVGEHTSFNHYKIYNELGQIITEGQITSNQTLISTQNFCKGVYHILLFNNKGESKGNIFVKD